eukprot:908611-Pleurochrysis_carterae.AAC.1
MLFNSQRLRNMFFNSQHVAKFQLQVQVFGILLFDLVCRLPFFEIRCTATTKSRKNEDEFEVECAVSA